MLSLILSRVFRLCGIIVLLAGLTTIISQLLQKPIHIPADGGFITLGEPGIRVSANRSNSSEHMAPDTTVTYVFRDSTNRVTASGMFRSGKIAMPGGSKKFNETIASKKESHEKLQADTTITIIGQQHLGVEYPGSFTDMIIQDSTENYKKVFAAASRSAKLKLYKPINSISEEYDITSTLRIMPANGWQRAGFVLYDIIRFACLTFLFFCLAILFRNFSRKDFFTSANVSLLKRTGWCLLVPTLAAGLLYWIFLFRLRPVKLVFADDENMAPAATYDISSGIDWRLILLGAALLVMAYIFADAFEIKEDRDLII